MKKSWVIKDYEGNYWSDVYQTVKGYIFTTMYPSKQHVLEALEEALPKLKYRVGFIEEIYHL